MGTRRLLFTTTYCPTETALANSVFIHLLPDKDVRKGFENSPIRFVIDYVKKELLSEDRTLVEEQEQKHSDLYAEVAEKVKRMLKIVRNI